MSSTTWTPCCFAQSHRVGDLREVRVVELAALGLEGRPREVEPHDVEALRRDAGEVVLGQRPRRRDVGARLVEVDELVHVDPAQQHLVAVAVGDEATLGTEEARRARMPPRSRHPSTPWTPPRPAPFDGQDERRAHGEHGDGCRGELQHPRRPSGANPVGDHRDHADDPSDAGAEREAVGDRDVGRHQRPQVAAQAAVDDERDHRLHETDHAARDERGEPAAEHAGNPGAHPPQAQRGGDRDEQHRDDHRHGPAVGARRRDAGRIRRARPPEPGEQRRQRREQHRGQPDRHGGRPERFRRDRDAVRRTAEPPGECGDDRVRRAPPWRSRSRPPTRRPRHPTSSTRQVAACASMTASTTPATSVQNRSPARIDAHQVTASTHGHEHRVRGERPDADVEPRLRPGPADQGEQPGGIGDRLDHDQRERGGQRNGGTANRLHDTPS